MNEIFRKKSLNRIKSPEDLNEYMRVTNPPIWFALICVVLILTGSIFWGLTAKLETKSEAVVIAKDSGVFCYISADDIDNVEIGTIVRIGKAEYNVTDIVRKITLPSNDLSEYEMGLAGFENGEDIYEMIIDGNNIKASTKADVILEEISPASFLLGGV